MTEEPRRPGPSAGAILLGIFFLLFGISILLVGGGCTILWITMLAQSHSQGGEEIGLLLLSIFVALAGILSIYFSIRLFRGPPAAPPLTSTVGDERGT